VLDDLTGQIAAHRPRPWHRWIGRPERATVRAVRERREAGGHLRVEHRAILLDRVALRDRWAGGQYAATVRDTLHRSPVRSGPRCAAILALAARGQVKTVVTRRERREHGRTLDEPAVSTGPVADALRKAPRNGAPPRRPREAELSRPWRTGRP
jgi:hypothetical protein